jgi:hypothetical protein
LIAAFSRPGGPFRRRRPADSIGFVDMKNEEPIGRSDAWKNTAYRPNGIVFLPRSSESAGR